MNKPQQGQYCQLAQNQSFLLFRILDQLTIKNLGQEVMPIFERLTHFKNNVFVKKFDLEKMNFSFKL